MPDSRRPHTGNRIVDLEKGNIKVFINDNKKVPIPKQGFDKFGV